MLDEIVQMVKDHLANNPAVANAIPADQADAIHTEIANHIANTVAAQPAADQGGAMSGLIGKLESVVAGGGPMVNAVEGSLVNTLTTKFGLPPSITGAISGALPGLLQKFASKA
jgi:hypothetical protein